MVTNPNALRSLGLYELGDHDIGKKFVYEIKNGTGSHNNVGEYCGIITDDGEEYYRFKYFQEGEPYFNDIRLDDLSHRRMILKNKMDERKTGKKGIGGNRRTRKYKNRRKNRKSTR